MDDKNFPERSIKFITKCGRCHEDHIIDGKAALYSVIVEENGDMIRVASGCSAVYTSGELTSLLTAMLESLWGTDQGAVTEAFMRFASKTKGFNMVAIPINEPPPEEPIKEPTDRVIN